MALNDILHIQAKSKMFRRKTTWTVLQFNPLVILYCSHYNKIEIWVLVWYKIAQQNHEIILSFANNKIKEWLCTLDVFKFAHFFLQVWKREQDWLTMNFSHFLFQYCAGCVCQYWINMYLRKKIIFKMCALYFYSLIFAKVVRFFNSAEFFVFRNLFII